MTDKIMSEYERIRAACEERWELWEDPDFPATQSSVFYHQTPPFNFVWKRPKEIYTKPTFVNDSSNVFDVVPGKLGDKWFVSCLGVLFLSKELLYRVVPADQRMDTGYAGVFRFRIWWCGQWVEVLVDDRLPTVNGRLAFLQTTSTDQLWPALLEKAYAKLHGSYEALKYGTLLDGMADLTGGITESCSVRELPDASALKTLLSTTSIVTAYYPNSDRIKGLDAEMNYRVCGVDEVKTDTSIVQTVRLRRPIVPRDSHRTEDGKRRRVPSAIAQHRIEFSMSFPEFQQEFSYVEMVHLDAETSATVPTLADKQKWQVKEHQGAWRRGVTAGGCRNNVNFFHMNPQIELVVKEYDRLVVSLNQHSVMEPKVVGFSIYKLSATLTETATQEQVKRLKSTINSQYTNSRQVSQRCDLQPGAYLIMPTTFEPREEARFSLRVFSTKPIRMRALDVTPQMTKSAVLRAPAGLDLDTFAQYEAIFLQLADEHRTIDAFELQELLDACLPNDYIKSCATIDTCRQIVLSLDTNSTGRISLSNFKDLMCSLKHWQTIFKTHAREKMGVLVAERVRDALREIGFVVPDRTMTLLLLRYMRKDGMLRFGDFVSTVMHLHRAFNVFNASTANRSNYVNFTLSEWLKCALTC